jgi:hypothetical protein
MPEIIIMGLSGDSKVLPLTATKIEIINAILKTAKEDKTEEPKNLTNRATTKGEGGRAYP